MQQLMLRQRPMLRQMQWLDSHLNAYVEQIMQLVALHRVRGGNRLPHVLGCGQTSHIDVRENLLYALLKGLVQDFSR